MKPSAVTVSRLLSAHGVTDVVMSPGSRCAPLVMALHRNRDMKLTTVVDERVAAFVALGMARQLRRPVALACTSGTAVLNYAPAVAEAYYQGIPLIVLSADRPMQWIDQDDSQTIRQYRALDNIVKASYDIPDYRSDDGEMSWYAGRTVNEAILTALDGKQGPVHVNCQYNAPLTDVSSESDGAGERVIQLLRGSDTPDMAVSRRLACHLMGKNVLVVAGFMPPDHRLSQVLRRFVTLPNVALLPEALANLHMSRPGGIDRILTGLDDGRRLSLLPDVVITIGGALLSRKVKEWLRSASPAMEHWSLDRADALADCFRHLTMKITASPRHFFSGTGRMLSRLAPRSDYSRRWQEAADEADRSHDEFMRNAPWSDLLAQQMIYNTVPENWSVYCSNGTCVRYAELFATAGRRQLCCNRGTSGIEGVTSTAIGSALAFNGITLLVSGDMSIRHDLGGLALPCVPDNFKVIVFANGGGDIFRFIPATRGLAEREERFACPRQCGIPLNDIATAFGYRYLAAFDKESLTAALDILVRSDCKTLLEIFTSPHVNADVLSRYMSRADDK